MRFQLFRLALFCVTCLLPFVSNSADELPSYNVGIVTDGSTEDDQKILALFQKELKVMAEGEYTINFPRSMILSGNDAKEGTQKAIEQLYNDPAVDIILALGNIASHLVFMDENPPKPVVAPYVIDSVAELYTETGAKTARSNLTYIDTMFYLDRDILSFQKIAPVENLCIIVDSRDINAIPQLKKLAGRLANEHTISVNLIPAGSSAESILAMIPNGTDSVMVADLYHLSDKEKSLLTRGLIDLRLPGYALEDSTLVNKGLLMGGIPEDMQENLARRTAISVQDILLGEQAGSLDVSFARGQEMTINMATARALDIYPSLAIMTRANLLNEARTDIKRRVTLQQVIKEALEVNLDLLSADRTVLAGQHAVKEARSPLLPQVGIATGARAIDDDRAEFGSGSSPERAWTGAASGLQQIYSERSWAAYTIEKHNQTGRERDRDSVRLDTIYQASVAYFNVLRAKTIEQLEKDNLKLTQANLKRARIRISAGIAGPDELYRWETKNASDSRAVLNKESITLDTMEALNRILNRPLQELFIAEETDLSDPLLIVGDRFFFELMNNPKYLRPFNAFAMDQALVLRPELKSIDAAIAAKERRTTASKREFWLPDFTIEGQVEQYFSEDGKGQRGDYDQSLDDTDWQIGLFATLPLFEGGRKSAAFGRNQEELQRLKIDRRAAAERVSQDMLQSLNRTRASYPGISLSREGADFANRNLELITDSYLQGLKSIIELLDAQNQALSADQAAANAVYDFLVDLMGVQRAMGMFILFEPEEERSVWIERARQSMRSE